MDPCVLAMLRPERFPPGLGSYPSYARSSSTSVCCGPAAARACSRSSGRPGQLSPFPAFVSGRNGPVRPCENCNVSGSPSAHPIPEFLAAAPLRTEPPGPRSLTSAGPDMALECPTSGVCSRFPGKRRGASLRSRRGALQSWTARCCRAGGAGGGEDDHPRDRAGGYGRCPPLGQRREDGGRDGRGENRCREAGGDGDDGRGVF
jgi:hypothetical protein